MKHLILVPIAALGLAACDTPEQTIAAGAVTGAALGGEGDVIEGALIGAAAGATYEYIRRREGRSDQCLYRNLDTGELRYADCV